MPEVVDLASSSDDDEEPIHYPEARNRSSQSNHYNLHSHNHSPPRTAARRRRNRRDNEVISLIHSPERSNSDHDERTNGNHRTTSNNNVSYRTDDEWSCQRCTLLNHSQNLRCLVCDTVRTSSSDDDDDVVYQHTAPATNTAQNNSPQYNLNTQNYPNNSTQPTPTSHYAASGVLLGSIFGAADAYAHGTGVARGVVRGAVSGGLGGVLMGEMLTNGGGVVNGEAYGMGGAAAAAGAAAAYGTNASATASTASNHPSHHSHYYNPTPHHFTSFPHPNRTYIHQNPTILDHFLHYTRFQQQHPRYNNTMAHHPNIDNLSYEQLLHLFGDGNEHRNLAAPSSIISSLPRSTVTTSTLESLPEKASCVICMEEYVVGDVRMVLPCCHGFHEGCLVRWLGGRGCCPVCMMEVGG